VWQKLDIVLLLIILMSIVTKTNNKKVKRVHSVKKKPVGLHHRIHHHVKRAFYKTPKFIHGMVAGAFLGVLIIGVLQANGSASAAAVAVATPDCDNNSVIYCGASSASQLVGKYKNGDQDPYGNSSKTYMIHDIYSWFGISSSDVNSLGSDAVTGYATDAGDVYTGTPGGSHTLVATGALTGGRQDIGGNKSTQEKYGATSFWVRPPSVSFASTALKAYVVMKNGVFQYAVLYSCGNPIKATPVKPPKPPAPKASINCYGVSLTPGTKLSNGDQNFTIEAFATPVNGATISGYSFNFGDTTANDTVSSSARNYSVSHAYAPGSYKGTATVSGSNAQNSSCNWTVTVNQPGVPTVGVTPPPSVQVQTAAETSPLSLPNTGPGVALVIIAIASVVGGYVTHMTHRHVRKKRAAKQLHQAHRHHRSHAR
jgi:hypothetical protein